MRGFGIVKKIFLVTPTFEFTAYLYPWFAFGNSVEEVEMRFPGCSVEEDK
jgi:hypothetical protein